MDDQCYWVYILQCSNNSYYTGYTNHLIKRYQSHLAGTGKCKYTRSFKPIAMVQCWKISSDKAVAMQVERHIKKLSRSEKEKLIAEPAALATRFSVASIGAEELLLISASNNAIKE